MPYLKKIIVVFLSLLFWNNGKVNGQTLRVGVSANAQFVMDSVRKVFEEQFPAKIDLIVSSSGKLTAQIQHGAPYDIFLSADMKYPASIYKAGNAITAPKVYAYGRLVMWTMGGKRLIEPDAITSPAIRTIAIANPVTAPYGVAAIAALKKSGVYNSVRSKIVYGESIAQVNQYLLGGAAEVAFTAMSVVKSPALAKKGHWAEVNTAMYPPIEQGVVILKHAEKNNLPLARSFYNFLFTLKAKSIFRYFGYMVH